MKLREWATPLTIGSFTLIAATGVLMFFHLDSGLNKLAHEWLGWVMLAAVGLHAAANFMAFKIHFKRPATLVIVGAFLVLLAVSFISPAGSQNRPAHIVAAQALLDAPIELVAQVAGKDTPTVLSNLRGAGFAIAPGQTLRQVSGSVREKQMQALGVAFKS